jgi:ABC-2 type transport system permease protein
VGFSRSLRFFGALLATSLKTSLGHRGAWLLQASFMALNNVLFFTTFWILFARFESIRGFRVGDMELMFGVSAVGFGLAIVTCGGMLDLAQSIAEGELDTLLAQPKNVLVRAVASRSNASGFGDVVSGTFLIWHSGLSNPTVLLAVLLAALAFVSASALIHSAAFWLGRVNSLARALVEFVITFTLYPPTLFGFGFKLVLFTLIPAGVVAYLPVDMVRQPSLRTVAIAAFAVAAHACVALFVFRRGLRRYESGSRFSVLG